MMHNHEANLPEPLPIRWKKLGENIETPDDGERFANRNAILHAERKTDRISDRDTLRFNALAARFEERLGQDKTLQEVTAKLELMMTSLRLDASDLLSDLTTAYPSVTQVLVPIEETLQVIEQLRQERGKGLDKENHRKLVALSDSERDKLKILSRRNPALYQRELDAYATKLQDPQFQWDHLLELAQVPQDVIMNSDMLIQFSKLQFFLQELSSLPPQYQTKELLSEIRAYILEKHFDSDTFLDVSIRLDLAEGRYDRDDPWVSQSLMESLLALEQVEATSVKNPWTKRIVCVVLLSVATSAALGAFAVEQPIPLRDYLHDSSLLPSLIPQDTLPAISPLIAPEDNDPQIHAPIEESTPEPTLGPDEWTDSSSPENSGPQPDVVLWTMTSNTAGGQYFRTATAYDMSNTSWTWETNTKLDYTVPIPRIDETQMIFDWNQSASTVLTSAFPLREGASRIVLPLQADQKLIFVEVLPSTEGVGVQFLNDGTAFLNVSENARVESIQIGMAPRNSEQLSNTPWVGTADFRRLMGDVRLLPAPVREGLDRIRTSGSSSDARAQAVWQFINDTLDPVYSTNPAYTDYYRESNENGAYIRRLIELHHGDCDVWATLGVAFLRYVGLEARFVRGYLNNGGFLDSNPNALSSRERHGWVEYYNRQTNEWDRIDFTPATLDPESMEELLRINPNFDLSRIRLSDLSQLFQNLGFLGLSIQKFLTEFGTTTAGISFLILLLTRAGIAVRNKKNKDEIIRNFELLSDDEIAYLRKHDVPLGLKTAEHIESYLLQFAWKGPASAFRDKGKRLAGVAKSVIGVEEAQQNKIRRANKDYFDKRRAKADGEDLAVPLMQLLGRRLGMFAEQFFHEFASENRIDTSIFERETYRLLNEFFIVKWRLVSSEKNNFVNIYIAAEKSKGSKEQMYLEVARQAYAQLEYQIEATKKAHIQDQIEMKFSSTSGLLGSIRSKAAQSISGKPKRIWNAGTRLFTRGPISSLDIELPPFDQVFLKSIAPYLTPVHFYWQQKRQLESLYTDIEDQTNIQDSQSQPG